MPTLSFTQTQGHTTPTNSNNTGGLPCLLSGGKTPSNLPFKIFPSATPPLPTQLPPPLPTTYDYSEPQQTYSSIGKSSQLPIRSTNIGNTDKKTNCIAALDVYMRENIGKEEIRAYDYMERMKELGMASGNGMGVGFGQVGQGMGQGMRDLFGGGSNGISNNGGRNVFGQSQVGGVLNPQGQQ